MAKWWQLERRPPSPWGQRIQSKFVGPIPPKGASRLEQMRFVRRISGRTLLVYGPILALVLALGVPKWQTVLIAALLLASSANLLSITLKIRRAEKAQRERP